MFQYSTSLSAHSRLLNRMDLHCMQNPGKRVFLDLIGELGRSSLTQLYRRRRAMLYCHGNDGGCVRYSIANAINALDTNLRNAYDMLKKACFNWDACVRYVTGLKIILDPIFLNCAKQQS